MDSGLILLIISLVAGVLFNGKGKKKEPEKGPQPKPFTATGRVPDNPASKLKEMSKELYRELQKEMQGGDTEPPSRQLQRQQQPPQATVQPAPAVPQPARVSVERKERADSSGNRHIERPDSSVNRHSGRLTAHGGKRQSVSAIEKTDLMPKNQEDLLKGIVFSEIFGPPKSKR
ncbi:MAG: hypothetical protein ABS920_07940 [Sporosarcina sp.]